MTFAKHPRPAADKKSLVEPERRELSVEMLEDRRSSMPELTPCSRD